MYIHITDNYQLIFQLIQQLFHQTNHLDVYDVENHLMNIDELMLIEFSTDLIYMFQNQYIHYENNGGVEIYKQLVQQYLRNLFHSITKKSNHIHVEYKNSLLLVNTQYQMNFLLILQSMHQYDNDEILNQLAMGVVKPYKIF